MPGQTFLIPLTNHVGLMEIQDYLKKQLPDGSEFLSPEDFHITLVYAEEQAGMEKIIGPTNLPMFGLAATHIDTFNTDDGYAVHLSVSKSPLLVTLQAYLFYEALGLGIKPSSYSWPGLFQPHITMAYVPKFSDWDEERYVSLPVPVYLHVDQFLLKADDETLTTYRLLTEVATRPVMEMTTVREMFEWTFGGQYPDVPTAPDVDLDALINGDADPFFVTLPAFQVDRPSANGRLIPREVGLEIVAQINAEKPSGILGHLRDEDRETEFPQPVVEWIGAILDNDMGWVKGYVPPGEVREMLRRAKAKNAKAALSIYGTAEHTYDRKREAWILSEMELETIDLAPPKRSGFGLAVVPKITAEIGSSYPPEQSGDNGNEDEETNTVSDNIDRTQVIREMTASDAALVPDAVRQVFLNDAPERKIIAEMRGVLDLTDDDDLVKVVTEMATTILKMERQAMDDAIVREVASKVLPGAAQETGGVKSLRSLAVKLVHAEQPQNLDAVPGLVEKVAQSDEIKAQASAVVAAEMGPNHRRRVAREEGRRQKIYFDIPRDEDEK